MQELKKFIEKMAIQDNEWIQMPIYVVMAKVKIEDDIYYQDEDWDDIYMPLDYCWFFFTKEWAEKFIEKFSYKYDDMYIKVFWVVENEELINFIKKLFEITGVEKPHFYY